MSRSRYVIRAAAALNVLRAAERRGVARAEVLEAAGIDDFTGDPDRRITYDLHFSVWTAAMKTVGDPGFPIDVGSSMTLADLEVLGFACRSAPDLAASLDVVERFGRLHASEGTPLRRQEEDQVRIYLPPSGPLPLGARAATESVITQTLQFARELVEFDFRPLEVTFRHPRPERITRHRGFFGVAPTFDAELASIVVAAEDLRRPVAQADSRLHRVLLRQAEADLSSLPQDAPFSAEVRRAVVNALPSGAPNAERVARELGCGLRTLRRRLDEEGTSFRGVVDSARADLARRYLESETLSREEVALLLGFSDARAFRRAYQRWSAS